MNRFSGLLDRAGQLATQVGSSDIGSQLTGMGIGALSGMAADKMAEAATGGEGLPDGIASLIGSGFGSTLGTELLRKAAARKRSLPPARSPLITPPGGM